MTTYAHIAHLFQRVCLDSQSLFHVSIYCNIYVASVKYSGYRIYMSVFLFIL